MFSLRGFNPYEFPHELKTQQSYHDDCSRCEIVVRFSTREEVESVRRYLEYDKFRGRILTQNILVFGLCDGDRLEPSVVCPDIAELENVALPADITFWRDSKAATVKRRNPIFNGAIGMGLECLVVDILHCMFLGCFNDGLVFVGGTYV